MLGPRRWIGVFSCVVLGVACGGPDAAPLGASRSSVIVEAPPVASAQVTTAAPSTNTARETVLARVEQGSIGEIVVAGDAIAWAHTVEMVAYKQVNRLLATPKTGGETRVLSDRCGRFESDLVVAEGVVFFQEQYEAGSGKVANVVSSVPLAGGAHEARMPDGILRAITPTGPMLARNGELVWLASRGKETRVLARDTTTLDITRGVGGAFAGGRVWLSTVASLEPLPKGARRTIGHLVSVDEKGGALREEYVYPRGHRIGSFTANADGLYWIEQLSDYDESIQIVRTRALTGGAPRDLLVLGAEAAVIGLVALDGDLYWQDLAGDGAHPIWRLRRGAEQQEQVVADSSAPPAVERGALYYARDLGEYGKGGELVRTALDAPR